MENNGNFSENENQDLQGENMGNENNQNFRSNLDSDSTINQGNDQQRSGTNQMGLDSDEFNEMGDEADDEIVENLGEEDLSSADLEEDEDFESDDLEDLEEDEDEQLKDTNI